MTDYQDDMDLVNRLDDMEDNTDKLAQIIMGVVKVLDNKYPGAFKAAMEEVTTELDKKVGVPDAEKDNDT